MTAVEAMACGTPTVITTEGGLWEMVNWGTEALYANPLDPDAFGHALATVLLYPRVAEQLARMGPQRARSSFTWNGIAQQLVNTPRLHRPDAHPGPAGPRSPVMAEGIARETAWQPVGSS